MGFLAQASPSVLGFLADALIGATALEHDLTLLTANTKHFGAVEGMQVEAFAP